MTDDAVPYIVPREPGRWKAPFMALVVHAALFAFLWFGVRWQSEVPAGVEAEVWSPQAREAAPLPQPQPEPPAETPPPQKVEQPPEPPRDQPPPKVEQPQNNPDIVLEQEKKRKAEQLKAKREEERQEQAKARRLAELEREEKRKEAEERRARQLADAAQKKKDAEVLRKLEAQKTDQLKKQAAEKLAADKKRQAALEAQQSAKLRDEEMRRITGGAVGTGGSGDAAKSQGSRADAGYAQRVAAKIKSNINFAVPESLAGNPSAEFEVQLLPDGSVAGMRKTKSSGVPGFDEAVQRAIERSQPYPPDKSGVVPRSFTGIHKPKDQ